MSKKKEKLNSVYQVPFENAAKKFAEIIDKEIFKEMKRDPKKLDKIISEMVSKRFR